MSIQEERGPEARRPNVAGWVLAGIIGLFGIVVFLLMVRSGRADSALLFVGLPIMLAIALVIMPVRSTHGRVFRVTTVVLLLAAVALHEGVICVILAAPLVYAVVHATTAIVAAIRDTSAYALLPVPLLIFGAFEGATEDFRVIPDQSVTVVRTVALPADEVLARLGRGPQPTRMRSLPLNLLRVPMPQHVHGEGLAVGDRWTLGYHGGSHGPGGQVVTQVSSRQPGQVGFTFVADTAITARWFTWQHADISWRAVDSGHTEVRLRMSFHRRLDPSWYFGPLQDALVHEGGDHFLDMLSLT